MIKNIEEELKQSTLCNKKVFSIILYLNVLLYFWQQKKATMSTPLQPISFDDLFRIYKNRFIRFAQTYVREASIAEDFVIDALIYYWEHRHSIEANSNIPAYILTIIKHKCLNHLQHIQLANQVSEKIANNKQWELNTRIDTLEACDPQEVFAKEAQEIVYQTIAKMSLRTREVFLMSRFENKSNNEIATELNIVVKTVEFHMSKALKELKIALKDYLPLFFYFFV